MLKRILLAFAALVRQINSGAITPDVTAPFVLQTTDKGYRSEYIFKMSMATAYTPVCRINIQFPSSQYPESLGLYCNIKAYSPAGNLIPVTVTDRTLSFNPQVSIAAGTSFELSILDILNPQTAGQTGQFQVF